MRHTPRTVAAIAAAGLLAATAAVAAGSTATADTRARAVADNRTVLSTAIGLSATGTRLSSFSPAVPRLSRDLGSVTGLAGDTKLVGIDWRVQDKQVYGVGDAGGVYTLDTRTAAATKVSQLTVALSGTHFGVDFNPAADRLRIISDTGQNLRHNPVSGGATLTDGTLAYTPGTPATGLTAAAYTNNDLTATTGTTLFDIDTTRNQVAQQVPANDGTLVLAGPLGVDATAWAGFDIATTQRDGVAVGNLGYAVLYPEGESLSSLYRIDLLSGAATRVGGFRTDVADLAVVPQR